MKKLLKKRRKYRKHEVIYSEGEKRNIHEEYFIFNIKMRVVNNDENFIEEFY